MLVKDLMTTSVASCEPTDTLDHAAEQMWRRDCGALPVCDDRNQQVLGMITDRDICLYAHFHHRALTQMLVDDAMTSAPKTCKASDSLASAEAIMSQALVRRLPVVSDSGELVGILSLADVAQAATREERKEAPNVTQTEVADTLSAICAPHLPEASTA